MLCLSFLCCRRQHKERMSQGGERSEATSAFEMVPCWGEVFYTDTEYLSIHHGRSKLLPYEGYP